MAEVMRLPLPERLEPKQTKRTLMQNVRIYFYNLYNGANTRFKELLVSVSNKDALNGNRLFDRHEAVIMIKELAEDSKDTATIKAKDGEIYLCISRLMRAEGIGLKLRRSQYKELTQQRGLAPAE